MYDLFSSRACNCCIVQNTEELIAIGAEKAQLHSTTKSLSTCAGCQLISYCGEEHQRRDWPLHREFCQAIKRICAEHNAPHALHIKSAPCTREDMLHAIIALKQLAQLALGRPLQFHEEEMTSFPVYCAVCYKLKAHLHCQKCRAVSYCSAAHQTIDAKDHELHCEALQLYLCPFKAYSLYAVAAASQIRARVPLLRTTDLARAFQCCTRLQLPKLPTMNLADYQLFSHAADFSCVATLCAALEVLLPLPKRELTICIVGATIERQLWFSQIHTEFFFIHFPNVVRLKLYFIGPELEVPDNKIYVNNFFLQNIERRVTYISKRGLMQNQQIDTPDFFIAYNCGFSENTSCHIESSDTWSLGILSMLLTFDTPLIFTSYTRHEAQMDSEVLMRVAKTQATRLRLEYSIPLMRNSFRDLRPCRDWQHKDGEEIFYRNGYLQCVVMQRQRPPSCLPNYETSESSSE